MKTLIIHGSPRKGNTWDVLNKVKEKLNEGLDIEYETLELSKLKLGMCVGCFNCILKSETRCPHYNIMQDVVKKIEDADTLIITSPVYSLQITGILKNFIDHMSYNFHRPRYFGKRAIIITTTAGVSENEIANYLEEVMNFWGITSVYKISMKYRDDISDKDMKKINMITSKYIEEVKNNKQKSPTFKNVAYYNAWRSMSLNLYEEGTVDYDYWMNSGLYKYPYHPDIKVSPIKKMFGNVMYKSMSKGMRKNKISS